jgi:hypothetical protein
VNGEGASDYGGGEQPTTGEEDGGRAGSEGEQAVAAAAAAQLGLKKLLRWLANFWFSGVALPVSLQEFCSVEGEALLHIFFGTILVLWY